MSKSSRVLLVLSLSVLALPASALAGTGTAITRGVVGYGTVHVDPNILHSVPPSDCTSPPSTPGPTTVGSNAGTEAYCASFVGSPYDICLSPAQCTISLQAVSQDAAGWQFDHWSGSCTGTTATCVLVTRTNQCVVEGTPFLYCYGPFTAIAHFRDTRTPTLSLTQAPAANSVVYSDTQSQQFAFHTDEDNESPSFECKKDTGAFAGCASPFTWASIGDGLHDFCVRARDPSGLVSGNACRHWEQETNPTATILTSPLSTNPAATASFTYSSNKTPHFNDGSSLSYLCRLDAAAFAGCPVTGQSYSPAPLINGAHTFQVEAVWHGVLDAPGVTHTSAAASYSWTQADPDGPTITLASSPNGTVNLTAGRSATISWTGDQPTHQQTFECKLDSDPSDFQPCTSPVTLTNLTDGLHDFRIRGHAHLTNNGPTKVVHWDQEVPADISLTAGPAAGTSLASRHASFSFTSSKPGVTFECRLDAGAFAACTSPHDVDAPTDGAHTFSVRATFVSLLDSLPHPGAASARTWTADTTPPDTTITSGPSAGLLTSEQSPSFAFTATEAGSFRCSLDGAAFAACASPHVVHVGIGAHTFRVAALDAVGNLDPTPAARAWTVAVDGDGDGYPAGVDCDDHNRAIHPGATDIPGDGIDQNCDLKDAPFPAIGTSVSESWTFFTKYTKLAKLNVTGVPAGATITITCKGKKPSCPFKKKTIKTHKKTKKIALAKYFKKAKLFKGTKIDVRITKPATIGLENRYTTRNGKLPKKTTTSLKPH